MLAKNGIKRMKTRSLLWCWSGFVAWGLGHGASRRVTVALSCPERRRGALAGVETHHTGRLGESPRLAGRRCMHGVIRPCPIAGQDPHRDRPGEKVRRMPALKKGSIRQTRSGRGVDALPAEFGGFLRGRGSMAGITAW